MASAASSRAKSNSSAVSSMKSMLLAVSSLVMRALEGSFRSLLRPVKSSRSKPDWPAVSSMLTSPQVSPNA
jgi:hypothetical protein